MAGATKRLRCPLLTSHVFNVTLIWDAIIHVQRITLCRHVRTCNRSLQNTELNMCLTECPELLKWMLKCACVIVPMRKKDNWKRLKFKLHWQQSVWHSSYGKNVSPGRVFFFFFFFCHFKYRPDLNSSDCMSCKSHSSAGVRAPLLTLTGQYHLPGSRRQQSDKLRHFLQWWGFVPINHRIWTNPTKENST